MKKIAFILAVALGSAAAFAQVNKGELKQLQNFLAQPAEKAATNAEALKITNITLDDLRNDEITKNREK